MTGFGTFFELGIRHIADLAALDHVLFLVVLAAIYRPRDWRDALRVVTAFTIGHSATLALAVTEAVVLPTAAIEFLIPITIIATGVANLAAGARGPEADGGRYRPLLAGLFGLVHGAGFANYLKAVFVGPIAIPLLGFNLGIEVGQVVVLGLVAIGLLGLDRLLAVARRLVPGASPYRLRVVTVSGFVVLLAVQMAAARGPW